MNLKKLVIIILTFTFLACNNESPSNTQNKQQQSFQNKGHELVYNMVQKVGDYNALLDKKDVIYTYKYQTPDGKADVSTEKYIFDGELSYGLYKQHERTFPDLKGSIEQGYDGKAYWLKHNGAIVNDKDRLKRVAFSRPTNFYWFAMMQKLLDPGLVYQHVGETTIDGKDVDVVKITFNSEDDKPKDIYQLYINQETSLADQFLFTVADFGVMDEPFLMELAYEQIDGMLIPTKRKYKKSTWNADVSEDPWINVTWSNIKFDNDLSKEDFRK